METIEDFMRRLQVCVRIVPPDSAFFDRDKMRPMLEAKCNESKRELLAELCTYYTDGDRYWPGLLAVIAELNHKYTETSEPVVGK